MSNSDELDEILSEIKDRQNRGDGDGEKRSDETNQASAPDSDEENFRLPDDEPLGGDETEDDLAAEIADDSETEETVFTNGDEKTYEHVFSDGVGETADDSEQPEPLQFDAIGDIEYPEEEMSNSKMNNKTKIIIAILAVIVIIALAVGIYFATAGKKTEEPATEPTVVTEAPTEAPVAITNPLTGEADYNKDAVGKRPVAIVVENAQAARPQWGIDSPDIIVEGEVEGGETRMLWLYSDYTSVPDQVGPIRSARPPYIRFSEMFDAVFIHWGQSKTKGNYVGANTVFEQDDVDHINQMTYSGSVSLFSRDSSRNVSSEHTGVLHGDKIAEALKELKIRTDAEDNGLTTFQFNEKDEAMGEGVCNTLALTFSSRTRTRDWSYSSDDKMYHSTDYETDVKMKNLIVLFDNTEYITKDNYKGSGSAEVYCDYGLDGGSGIVASEGTYTEIKWSKKDGKLSITDANGDPIKLNVGRSWIGYASANNGGKVVEG